MYPKDIITKLQNLKQQFESRPVALINDDVWRYGSDPSLLEFFKNDPRIFYIFTLGYDCTIRTKNIAEIPYQYFYFNRPHDNIEPDIDKQRKVGFSCLNNNSSFHRLILGCRLFCANLIDSMIFSQNVTEMPGGNYKELLDNIPGMAAYLSTLPRQWVQETSQNFASDHSINHCAYSDSYCNIVTETEMQEFVFKGPVIDLPILTEKSFKPFRAKQISCYMAAPGHMRYLKSLGFEIMTDLVEDEFDVLGVFDRAITICSLVARGYDYIQNYYHDHRHQIQHNFDLIQSDKVETLLYQNTQDFLHRFHQQI